LNEITRKYREPLNNERLLDLLTETVLQFRHRLTTLSTVLYPPTVVAFMNGVDFSLLESLSISVGPDDTETTKLALSLIGHQYTAPKLQSLTFQLNRSYPHYSSEAPLAILHALHAPNLETLSIEGAEYKTDFSPVNTPLFRVHSLYLTVEQALFGSVVRFLSKLVPNVREITGSVSGRTIDARPVGRKEEVVDGEVLSGSDSDGDHDETDNDSIDRSLVDEDSDECGELVNLADLDITGDDHDERRKSRQKPFMDAFMRICAEFLLLGDEILFPLLSEVQIDYEARLTPDDSWNRRREYLIGILKNRSTRTGHPLFLDIFSWSDYSWRDQTLSVRITTERGG